MENRLYKYIATAVTGIIFTVLLVACADEVGEFLIPPFGDVIILVNTDTDSREVSMYDINGRYLKDLASFFNGNKYPRGAVRFDIQSFLVSADLTDSIERVFLDGTREDWHGSALFSGAIYDIEFAGGHYFAIESSRIEAFDPDGLRDAGMYINTTVGGCTTSNPRHLTVEPGTGYLVSSNTGGSDNINRYDVSGASPTCISSTAFGNNPYGIVSHSNGNLYVATQSDDQIRQANQDGTGATVIFATDTTIINNPTAMAEMPNGDLLVSSISTDRIVRLQTDGTVVDSTFIQDGNTGNVTDILIFRSSSD